MQLANIRFSSSKLKEALAAINVATDGICLHDINNISFDSRQVNAHTIFVAVQGYDLNGHDYIQDAVKRGCKLVLCERLPSADKDDFQIIQINHLKTHLPTLLRHLYFSAVHDLKVAAVTGTNGKTSVAYLYAQLALSAATASASLGTLGLNKCRIESERIVIESMSDSINTTPDIISQFKVLSLLAEQAVKYYCLEASSHGIEQKRLEGMPINCAIFTNLTQDHLDYHGDMASYAKAKRGLLALDEVQYVLLNADDPESSNWQQAAPLNAKVVWFSLDETKLPINASYFTLAKNILPSAGGISFDLSSTWGERKVHLPLLGKFNVANFLAALSAHLIQGLALDALLALTKTLKGVPGRMELFSAKVDKGNFIVDYAHTPDALIQALKAARLHTAGQLYCVFGCGGNRDTSKRPLMGLAAEQNSDFVVLTQDNSRDESPENIIKDIQNGMNNTTPVHVELNRKAAIRWAWDQSQQADLILLAGKGHENYVEIKQQRIAYDERAYAEALCAEVAL
jgi:UDP-N-acetylmuramoyl-L-alanyl-D-glutamate--2,6-diaminopimelate ligase